MQIKAFLFDLDGVLVDTANFHYLAWRRLANQLGFELSPAMNEALKGVSRMDSLDRILDWGHIRMTDGEKQHLADTKNGWYVEMIRSMTPEDILPGALSLLRSLKERGTLLGLGSASRNAGTILKMTGLEVWFDVVVDGHTVRRSKPDPEVFLTGANALRVDPEACVVVEDAEMGLQAACAAGMFAVGIGDPAHLPSARICFPDIAAFRLEEVDILTNQGL